MGTVIELISSLDARTMILMAAILYFSLTMVLGYTFFFRKTYPGFACLALGQLFWSIGVVLIFYRFAGERWSLVLGNGLLFLQAICWYHGIAMYGEITTIRQRHLANVALATVGEMLIVYYTLFDFDTCRRIIVFSAYNAILYGRIAVEPFLVRQWKTYSMQGVYSAILLLVSLAYALRALRSLNATECAVGGPDAIVKTLLLCSMFLLALLTFCVLSMTSGRVEAELREARDALRQQAETDSLTGLSNRRHFLEHAQTVLEQARALGRKVSLVMLDLDHFKEINDTHGHQAGDLVLREVAHSLRAALGESGAIGRLGGEEFGVLLPGVAGAEALAVARRLRRAVADARPGGHRVTASLGVAECDENLLDSLLAKADEYLYAAKEAGRNRIVGREGMASEVCA